MLDALNRPVKITDPGSNITEHGYDRGGALQTVKVGGVVYVKDIHYDAKGQRQSIWYGNDTKTSYKYNALNYRLTRLLTVKLSGNDILQDLNYYYDPVGNITTIKDAAQQSLFFNNTVVSPTQTFTYDALYRLTQAIGRELKGTATFGMEDNSNNASWIANYKSDGAATQAYTQTYTYDAVGNIKELKHAAVAGSYTRSYAYTAGSNRLYNAEIGSPPSPYAYTYDARGNMLGMPHLDKMKWNVSNELSGITRGTTVSSYQYSGGQRVRKFVNKDDYKKEERIYFGSFEIYRRFEGSSLKVERQTLHVSDDTGRIAMLEKRTFGTQANDNDTEGTLTRYIYSNHLQSASLELNETGNVISYEEYHPYGTTSYRANNAAVKACAKRYRYTGKEKDEESGLYYHGARYYVPWLGRWTASDPLESKYAGMSSYNYSFNNPIVWNDLNGMSPGDGDKKYQTVSTSDATHVAQPVQMSVSPIDTSDLPDISQLLSTDNGYVLPTVNVTDSPLSRQEGDFGQSLPYSNWNTGDLPKKDFFNALGDHYEARLNQLDNIKAERLASQKIQYGGERFDPTFSRWESGELLKSYTGSKIFGTAGKALDVYINVNTLRELGTGEGSPITNILNSGGGALSAAYAGSTTGAIAGTIGFAAFALLIERMAKDKSVDFDLSVLQIKIGEGYQAISNEINNTGLGERLNIQAGFVDASTFNNIQKRGELDLSKDNVSSVKYLAPNNQIPLGSDDKPYPYLLIYPKTEPQTKNFFILQTKK